MRRKYLRLIVWATAIEQILRQLFPFALNYRVTSDRTIRALDVPARHD
jgi:hypothetical protein